MHDLPYSHPQLQSRFRSSLPSCCCCCCWAESTDASGRQEYPPTPTPTITAVQISLVERLCDVRLRGWHDASAEKIKLGFGSFRNRAGAKTMVFRLRVRLEVKVCGKPALVMCGRGMGLGASRRMWRIQIACRGLRELVLISSEHGLNN